MAINHKVCVDTSLPPVGHWGLERSEMNLSSVVVDSWLRVPPPGLALYRDAGAHLAAAVRSQQTREGPGL